MNEQAIYDILERLRSRFYGKYRGTVTEIDAATLRIKAKVPAVLGTQPTGWCTPCVPYAGSKVGFAFLPEEGAAVWIEFEGGDVSYPLWSGCFWRSDEKPEEAGPKVKTIVTAGGSKILLDDNAGAVKISDAHGNKVTLNASGMTLERGGQKVVINEASVSVNEGALEII